MNAKHLTRKELSALVPQYPSNFSDTNNSPLTTHHSPKRKLAFTLAEVLITLGIIGVVAALTIPTIISKYKHKELETRFRKVYSVLSQATVDLPTEYGRCEVANASEINDFVFNKLKALVQAL